MQEKFPALSKSYITDELTDSSGISLSNGTENTDFPLFSSKDRLQWIAHKHNGSQRSDQLQDKACKEHDKKFTPIFPRIDFTPKENEKEKTKMKSDYRLSSRPKIQLPVISAAPPTVGKYRQRVKVVPVQNLPSPSPQRLMSPPPATQYLMREQFRKERNQQSPGFNKADLARIFDHYSISRYLSSRESRPEAVYDDSSDRFGFADKTLPSLNYNTNRRANKTTSNNKSSKLVWIPRLSQWISEDQNRPIQYLKLGGGANMNLRRQPICCSYHDFFHKNLNWDVREWKPTPCPRYLHHHHHQQQYQPHKKKVNFSSVLNASKKRKPLTIPRDPFTSKNKRNIERPWLGKLKPTQVEPRHPSVTLVLPRASDDACPSHWMVDNSTMTEDSGSDVMSIQTSFYSTPSLISTISRKPQQVKKRTKVNMADKACDVMTPHPTNSREPSCYTEDTDHKEDFDQIEDLSLFSPIVNHDDAEVTNFEKDASFHDFINTTPTSPKKTKEDSSMIQKPLESEDTFVELDGASKLPSVEEQDDKSETVQPSNGADEDPNFSEIFYEKGDGDSTIGEGAESADDFYSAIIANDSEESFQKMTETGETADLQYSPIPMLKSKAKPPPPRLLLPSPKLITQDRENNKPTNQDNVSKKKDIVVVPLPKFLDRPVSSKSCRSGRTTISIHSPSPTLSRKRRGKVVRDTTLADEMNRARLAEERRKRATELFEKLKQERTVPPLSTSTSPVENFEDDNFLNKFSILNSNKIEAFRKIFDSVDIDEDGYLDCEELLLAIQKVLPNDSLKESHINHIYRLLDLANQDILSKKTGFTLFSIIASLAQKITTLNDFMQGLVDRFDFQSLDTKMWKARQLFNHYVDDAEAQTISMQSLWIELKAGGVSKRHENKIRDSLKHLPHLDVLDFMTYLPLFTFTYSHAVKHPLREEIV